MCAAGAASQPAAALGRPGRAARPCVLIRALVRLGALLITRPRVPAAPTEHNLSAANLRRGEARQPLLAPPAAGSPNTAAGAAPQRGGEQGGGRALPLRRALPHGRHPRRHHGWAGRRAGRRAGGREQSQKGTGCAYAAVCGARARSKGSRGGGCPRCGRAPTA